MKISLALCQAIVEAWNANAAMFRIADETWGDVPRPKYWINAKPWLAQCNVLASDALWDGHPNRAMNLMRKHGFGDKRAVKLPPKVSGAYKQSRFSALAHQENLEANARRAWNVCK